MRRQPHNPRPDHPTTRSPSPSSSPTVERRALARAARVAAWPAWRSSRSAMPAALAVTGSVAGKTKHSPAKAAVDELIVNGDFEDGTTGWKVNRRRPSCWRPAKPAVSGAAAAQLTNAEVGNVVVNDVDPTIISTTAGRTYAVSAYVRATGAEVKGKIRIREIDGGAELASFTAPFTAVTGSWTRVDMTYTSTATGAKLDLNVVGRKVEAGAALLVDDVSMTAHHLHGDGDGDRELQQRLGEPVGAAVVQLHAEAVLVGPDLADQQRDVVDADRDADADPRHPRRPPSQCVSDRDGDPGHRADLPRRGGERRHHHRDPRVAAGQPMRLHRTYYQADQIDRAVNAGHRGRRRGPAALDQLQGAVSAGRTWPPASGDAWAADLADALRPSPDPVWLAIHHEPRTTATCRSGPRCSARIAPIIHAAHRQRRLHRHLQRLEHLRRRHQHPRHQVAGQRQRRRPAIDAYNDYGVGARRQRRAPSTSTSRTYYVKLAAWAEAHGTAWGDRRRPGSPSPGAKVDPTWLDACLRGHDRPRRSGDCPTSTPPRTPSPTGR